MMNTDCLIIGGGLAGWWAAREVVKAGLKAVMAEDGMGASPWVHGFNNPVRTGDSADVFFEDTQKSGQGLSDRGLARTLCGDASVIFDEIQAMGLSFNRTDSGEYQAIRPLGASFPRVISIGNETGTAILTRLRADIGDKVTDIPHSRALRLLKDGSRVTGALVYDKAGQKWITVCARAVILACGGFCGIFPVSTNKRDSGGDGYAMAFDAGAKLCDMEFIQFEPSAAVWPKALIGTSMITTLFFEGAVLRNKNGERFMLRYGEEGEKVGKDVMSRRIAAEIAAGLGTEHGGVYMDVTGVPADKLDQDYPMYVKRYLDVGIDLKKQWIELAPAPHTALGGVCIDPDGRTSVPGLYACGEVIGGLHGANRIGGSAGLETMVFGRRAGKAASAYIQTENLSAASVSETVLPVTGSESIQDQLTDMRQQMQQALRAHMGAVRTEEGLNTASAALQQLFDRAEALQGLDNDENFALLRLRNDLQCARIAVLSAKERKESLGCHTRGDHPEKPEKNYRVVISKNAGALPVAERLELPL